MRHHGSTRRGLAKTHPRSSPASPVPLAGLAAIALRAALATGALVAGGCASESIDGAMTVACDFDHEPFIGLDAAGEPTGRDVEMMEALAREIDLRLVWVKMPFPEILAAVEAGKVDAACATIGITDERAERVLFTAPYFETRVAVLVRTGEGEPRSLADLRGRRVAASAGTTSESALLARDLGAIPVLDNADKKKADARLLARDVDACVTDGPDADDFASRSGGALAVLAEPLAVERYAIALPKRKSDLRARLDAAIEAMRSRGALDALDREHGLAPARP